MMTNIEWYWDDVGFGVSAKGHAAYQGGNDIVCSAVSALLQTLYAGLEMQCFCRCDVRSGDGEYMLDCIPGERRKEAKILFDSIILGLELISQSYGAYVTVGRVKPER